MNNTCIVRVVNSAQKFHLYTLNLVAPGLLHVLNNRRIKIYSTSKAQNKNKKKRGYKDKKPCDNNTKELFNLVSCHH